MDVDGWCVVVGVGDNVVVVFGFGVGFGDVVVLIGMSGMVFVVLEMLLVDVFGIIVGFVLVDGYFFLFVCIFNVVCVFDVMVVFFGVDYDEFSCFVLDVLVGVDGFVFVLYFEGECILNFLDVMVMFFGMMFVFIICENFVCVVVEGMLFGFGVGFDVLCVEGVFLCCVLLIGGGVQLDVVWVIVFQVFGILVEVFDVVEYVVFGVVCQVVVIF